MMIPMFLPARLRAAHTAEISWISVPSNTPQPERTTATSDMVADGRPHAALDGVAQISELFQYSVMRKSGLYFPNVFVFWKVAKGFPVCRAQKLRSSPLLRTYASITESLPKLIMNEVIIS